MFHFKVILDLYVVCLLLFLTSNKLVRKILPDNGSISYMGDDEEEKKKKALVWFFFSKLGFFFVLSLAKHMFIIRVLLCLPKLLWFTVYLMKT